MQIAKVLNYRLPTGLLMLGVLLFLAVAVPRLAYAQTTSCENVRDSTELRKCVQDNQIVKDINTIIRVVGAGVGIIITIMLIIGGIQYMTAGENSQTVAAAKQRILNALLALLAFLLIFAFLQWLVPGGVFE